MRGKFKITVLLAFGFGLLSTLDSAALFSMASESKIPEGWDRPVIKVPGKIVFQSNRDGGLSEIWLLKNGELKKIITGSKSDKDIPKELPEPYRGLFQGAFGDISKPQWSPDGKKILCLGEGDILIFDEDGKPIERIKPSKYPHLARWSPDGRAIYFTGLDGKPDGAGSYNIFRLNLPDRSEDRITNLDPLPGRRMILSFAVSPKENEVIFTMVGEKKHGISIWKINTDGSDLKLIIKYADDPSWSPDGSKITYASSNLPDGQRAGEHDEIFIFDIKTLQTTRITNNLWNDRNPVFSPDGTKIVFDSTRHVSTTHGSEIFVINIDGTKEARLTPPQKNPKYPNDLTRAWATDEYADWTA